MEEEFRTSDYLLNKYEINKSGTIIRNIETKKPLKIKVDTHHCSENYAGHNVTFVHIGGRSPESKTIRIQVGRAVLESWVGKQPDGMQVDHWNRDSLDDNLENLRYVTKSEQMKNRDYSRIAKQGTLNLHNARMARAICVELYKDNEIISFQTMSECAKYLSQQFELSYHSVVYHLRTREEDYLGYRIVYTEPEIMKEVSDND